MISISRLDYRPVSLRATADLLQALGHPIRLQIVDALRPARRTVTEIVEALGLEQPVVSKHLSVLRDAGVVSARTQGRERVYELAPRRLDPLLGALFTPNKRGTAS